MLEGFAGGGAGFLPLPASRWDHNNESERGRWNPGQATSPQTWGWGRALGWRSLGSQELCLPPTVWAVWLRLELFRLLLSVLQVLPNSSAGILPNAPLPPPLKPALLERRVRPNALPSAFLPPGTRPKLSISCPVREGPRGGPPLPQAVWVIEWDPTWRWAPLSLSDPYQRCCELRVPGADGH